MSHAGIAPRAVAEGTLSRLVDVGARWQYRLLRLVFVPLFRLVFRIEVRGRDLVPATGPFVVAANHLNWPDAPLLLVAFPLVPRMNFVGDATFVGRSRLLWFSVRQLGGVLPVVEHMHATRQFPGAVDACLKRRGAVAFFPEGRYADREGSVLPFHRGFARIAVSARIPVIPVAISGTKDLWVRKRVVVEIDEPIDPEGHTPDSLAELTRSRIAALTRLEEPPAGPRLLRRTLTRLFP